MEENRYQILQQMLVGAGAAIAAAECHGVLCGRLCAVGEADPEAWIEECLGAPDPADAAGGRCRGALARLYAETCSALESAGVDLVLLLPPDSASLEQRVQALAEWCQGFLHGLAMGWAGSIEDLPADSREVVQDLLGVTRAGLEPGVDAEEQEQAYAEIVEYTRVGVLLIREELRAAQDEPAGRRLH